MSGEFQFLIYQSADEDVSVNAVIRDETIWLTQKSMAELFDVDVPAISKHLSNIYADGELLKDSTVSKMEIVQQEGARHVKRAQNFYNLDAIISVGYRVNSRRATQFRIWASSVLKEYIIKGFAMDDERLKQGKTAFGKDYFEELLERIRSIRASERRIWQKITDIFAECSIDYDKDSQLTHDFYVMVQNKFHYAIVGQTAAEIVYTQADRTKENMGLTTWERENTFTMEEFAASVNKFLAFREYDILRDHGKISEKMANKKASAEYEEFNKTQKITSDFDKTVNQMLKAGE